LSRCTGYDEFEWYHCGSPFLLGIFYSLHGVVPYLYHAVLHTHDQAASLLIDQSYYPALLTRRPLITVQDAVEQDRLPSAKKAGTRSYFKFYATADEG
jgi:hypothetical protein